MKNIGQEFMAKTKYKFLSESDQAKGLPYPPLEVEEKQVLEVIELPAPEVKLKNNNIQDLITNRNSFRNYSEVSLTLKELSYLLWSTQGIKKVINGKASFRTVPSAGARHAFETYLAINKVEGLQAGLYRFSAFNHRLIKISSDPEFMKKLVIVSRGQKFIEHSAVTFIWVAVTYRMTYRYVERGYRYLHLDAGHVCQNLYLSAESIGCGACAIAAFDDDEINSLLGLDGEESFVIYLSTVGKR